MTFLTLVLLVIECSLRGARWAYLAAALASVTRLEAWVLVPLVVLQDWLLHARTHPLRRIAAGGAASAGVLAWLAAVHQRAPLGGHPYVEELLTRDGSLVEFLRRSLLLTAEVLPPAALMPHLGRWAIVALGLGLTLTGVWVIGRRHRARSVTLLGFLAGYTLIHSVFPAYLPRYTFPVLWVLYLAMGAALEALLERLGRRVRAPRLRWAGAVAACALVGVSLQAAVRFMRSDYITAHRAPFRHLGLWYRQAARPGDRMLLTLSRIPAYYSGLPQHAFVRSETLEATSVHELREELTRRGITYVVWDNEQADEPMGYYARRFKTALLDALKAQPELEFVHHIAMDAEELMVFRVRPRPHAVAQSG